MESVHRTRLHHELGHPAYLHLFLVQGAKKTVVQRVDEQDSTPEVPRMGFIMVSSSTLDDRVFLSTAVKL
jgi:hypothetical protein